jgi:hypothetical protein
MPVDNKISVDPRLMVSDSPSQFNLLGPKNVLPYRTSANGASNNNVQFTTQLSPSDNQVLNSLMILELEYSSFAQGTGIAPTPTNLFTNVAAEERPTICFRSLGALRNMSELAFTINNSKLSVIPMNDLVNLGDFLYSKQEAKSLASFFPAQLDSAPVIYPDGTANCSQYNQPLSTYFNSDAGTSRACNTIVEGTNIKHYIPLIVSPFGKGYSGSVGLANVTEFSLNINFSDSNHKLEFCGSADANVSANIAGAYLHYGYLTPNAEVDIPAEAIYNYDNIITVTKNTPAPTVNSQQVSSDSLKVNVQPKLVYFSVSPDMSQAQDLNVLNVHARINKVSVLWGNKGSSFLSNYDSYDLWKMTMNNTGSDMSYQQWRQVCNVVCLRPAVDIGNDLSTLDGEVGSGVMFTIQNIDYDGVNLNQFGVLATYEVNWRLFVTIVSAGQVILEEGRLVTNNVVITPAEAVVASDQGLISQETVKVQAGESGKGLFDSIRSIFHKGHQLVKKGAQFMQSDLGKKAIGYLAGSSGSGMSAGGLIVQKPRRR